MGITINMDFIISMGIMIIMVIMISIEPQLEARKMGCVKKS